MNYLCLKDLFMDDGKKSFTKENSYKLLYGIGQDMTFKDDEGREHSLGRDWVSYFIPYKESTEYPLYN